MKCPYDENGSDQEYNDLVQRISIHPACKNQRDSGEIKKNHQKGKHQQALPWFQYLFFSAGCGRFAGIWFRKGS